MLLQMLHEWFYLSLSFCNTRYQPNLDSILIFKFIFLISLSSMQHDLLFHFSLLLSVESRSGFFSVLHISISCCTEISNDMNPQNVSRLIELDDCCISNKENWYCRWWGPLGRICKSNWTKSYLIQLF